jgi:hypothetical protein
VPISLIDTEHNPCFGICTLIELLLQNSSLVQESKEEEGASELSCSLVLLSQASWAHFGDLLSSTDDTLTGNC